MLYLIGIGLNNEKDISLKGLEAVKKSDVVYLENYTSKLSCSVKDLEKLYGKKIILADRKLVEQKAEDIILNDSKTKDVAFLIIGDVFGATTHVDLMLRAKKAGINVKIIHNSSILTAVGVVGLELYKYGKTTSIPFENKDVKAPIEVINQNKKNGLHTLVLLDLNPEQDKFMTINEALEYLVKKGLKEELKVVGCAGIGSDNAEIKYGKIKDIIKNKFTQFPQCLIVPGNLHFMEEEVLELYKQ
jgi:diphthine synthase